MTRVLIRTSVAVIYLAALVATIQLTEPMVDAGGPLAAAEAVAVGAADAAGERELAAVAGPPMAVDEAPLVTLAIAAGLLAMAGGWALTMSATRRLAARRGSRTERAARARIARAGRRGRVRGVVLTG